MINNNNSSHGIIVHELSIEQNISSQGTFDMILHKWSDFFYSKSGDKDATASAYDRAMIQARHQELQTYRTHVVPHCVILDPLESMELLMDRIRIYELLNQCRRDSRGEGRCESR
jgi:hypothetical protein